MKCPRKKPLSVPVFLFFLTLLVGWLLAPLGGSDANTARYLSQAVSLVDSGTFSINGYETSSCDISLVDNLFYPAAPPGLPVAISPLVWVSAFVYDHLPDGLRDRFVAAAAPIAPIPDEEWRAETENVGPRVNVDEAGWVRFLVISTAIRMLVSTPIMFLFLLGVYRLLKLVFPKVSNRELALACTILFLATHIIYFAGRLYSHVPGAAIIVWAIYLLLSNDRGEGWKAVVAGILTASLPLTDYILGVVGLLIGIIALFKLKRWKGYLQYGFAALPFVLFFFVYHTIHMGGPLTLAHAHIINENHVDGLYGIKYPSFSAIGMILWGRIGGFFLFAPIALPCFIATLWPMKNATKDAWVRYFYVLIFVVVLVIFSSYRADIVGGLLWWGPRYLVPVTAVLSFGCVRILQSRWRRPFLIFAGFAAVLGFLAASAPFDRVEWKSVTVMPDLIKATLQEGISLPFLMVIEELGILSANKILFQSFALLAIGVVSWIGYTLWCRIDSGEAELPSPGLPDVGSQDDEKGGLPAENLGNSS